MRTFLAFILLLLGSAASHALHAQKYRIEAEDLSRPLAVKELVRPAPHAVKISRQFDNESEEMLMRIAEATYPLASDAGREGDPGCGKALADIIGEPPWWYSEFDGVRIPYAVTKSAVAYYLKVSEDFREGRPGAPLLGMKSSSLAYSASITTQENYRPGEAAPRREYAVAMRLEWSQYCGPLCAMSFSKSRAVVLTAGGDILAVDGDGCAGFAVS